MILHNITITCSSDDEPEIPLLFVWRKGEDLFSVECAIAKLQEWVLQQKASPLAVALEPDNNDPIAK